MNVRVPSWHMGLWYMWISSSWHMGTWYVWIHLPDIQAFIHGSHLPEYAWRLAGGGFLFELCEVCGMNCRVCFAWHLRTTALLEDAECTGEMSASPTVSIWGDWEGTFSYTPDILTRDLCGSVVILLSPLFILKCVCVCVRASLHTVWRPGIFFSYSPPFKNVLRVYSHECMQMYAAYYYVHLWGGLCACSYNHKWSGQRRTSVFCSVTLHRILLNLKLDQQPASSSHPPSCILHGEWGYRHISQHLVFVIVSVLRQNLHVALSLQEFTM